MAHKCVGCENIIEGWIKRCDKCRESVAVSKKPGQYELKRQARERGLEYCCRCDQELPVEEFRRSGNGRQSNCRSCQDKYNAIRESAHVVVENAVKTCTVCNKLRPVEEFWINRKYKDGRESRCIDCLGEIRRNQRIKGRTSLKSRCKALNMDLATYDHILERQNNCCAICGRQEQKCVNGTRFRLSIDHDHTTGRHRGLLRQRCNSLLGQAGDNPRILLNAVAYLLHWHVVIPEIAGFRDPKFETFAELLAEVASKNT